MKPLPALLVVVALLLPGGLRAGAADSIDGWEGVAQREEIRPEFSRRGSSAAGSSAGGLIIRTDARAGLDGHWTKPFPVTGGQPYQFRVLRRLSNVASPRRSAVARILWRDAQGRPVRHDETGATSYAPGSRPVAEPEYPNDGATTPRHRPVNAGERTTK